MEARDNSTWCLVRDVGIFLYGCIFAGRYIFFGKAALHREAPPEEVKTIPGNGGAVPPFVRRNCRSYVRENVSTNYGAPPFGPYAARGFVR
jgi:hypothetical protein